MRFVTKRRRLLPQTDTDHARRKRRGPGRPRAQEPASGYGPGLFSTVRIADRIAVIAGGKVAELGTHHELVAAGGRYARLFEIQAAGYR